MRKSPSDAKLYDVGDGVMMTGRQIAEKIKSTNGTVRSRWAKGWRGPALLLPPGDRRKKSKPRTTTAVNAYALALRFGARVPTTREIHAVFPMCNASAMYWRNAIRAALEKHGVLTEKADNDTQGNAKNQRKLDKTRFGFMADNPTMLRYNLRRAMWYCAPASAHDARGNPRPDIQHFERPNEAIDHEMTNRLWT